MSGAGLIPKWAADTLGHATGMQNLIHRGVLLKGLPLSAGRQGGSWQRLAPRLACRVEHAEAHSVCQHSL